MARGNKFGPKRKPEPVEPVAPFKRRFPAAMVISVIALVVSIVSAGLNFWTNKQSLRIGQQAYLFVSNGTLTQRETQFDPKYSWNYHGLPRILITIDADFHNMGNTPATLRKIILNYFLPRGWTLANIGAIPYKPVQTIEPVGISQFELYPAEFPTDLPSRGQAHWSYTATAELTVDAYAAFMSRHRPSFVDMGSSHVVKIEVIYSDVFSEANSLKWAWLTDFLSPYPKTDSYDVMGNKPHSLISW